jgi:hypothetical protein
MHIDELLQPSVGANYAHYEITWPSRRCLSEAKRSASHYFAHTADLSAFAGYSALPVNLLNRIIGLCRMFYYPDLLDNLH